MIDRQLIDALKQASEFVYLGGHMDESNEATYAHAIVRLCRLLDGVCIAYDNVTEEARRLRGECDEDRLVDDAHAIAVQGCAICHVVNSRNKTQ
jgi:hypothetical protein